MEKIVFSDEKRKAELLSKYLELTRRKAKLLRELFQVNQCLCEVARQDVYGDIPRPEYAQA